MPRLVRARIRRRLCWTLLIPAVVAAASLDLNKVPLLRGVRLTRTDGTSDYGSVRRVTTQFVSFVSQQNGQCENVEVRKIASIKSEGPGPTDKFSPAGVALMAPIAAPFLAAHEVKHRFGRKGELDGQWQSSAAPGGAVTWLDIASGTIRKTFVIRKEGTYRVDGDNLAISYLPDQKQGGGYPDSLCVRHPGYWFRPNIPRHAQQRSRW